MKILVVEDDSVSRAVAVQAVKAAGHEVVECTSGEEGWTRFKDDDIDAVVSDWYMPGVDGLELCRRIRKSAKAKYTYFVLLTVASGRVNIRSAMADGVDDFLTKPLDFEELQLRLQVAARVTQFQNQAARAEERAARLEEQVCSRQEFQGMIGTSSEMHEVFRRLRLAAESPVSIFITGESGTGKELAAAAIHELSDRRRGPFLAVNCGAIPETILESELFGHVKGAFTGAHRDKAGLFELANEGTLFLDEIGDISLTMQQKLLRVIEEREIRRVGDEVSRPVDVRIVSATHRDIRDLVNSGRFREDLFYRVRVFPIDLPPLRERRGDIPLLVDHFVSELSGRTGKGVVGMASDVMRRVLEYPWPGNVRELRNVVEHAFVTVEGSEIQLADLPPELRRPLEGGPGPADADPGGTVPSPSESELGIPESTLARYREEARLVIDAVRATEGNRTHAAKRLGISRVALWKKIQRLELDDQLPPPPRGSAKRG